MAGDDSAGARCPVGLGKAAAGEGECPVPHERREPAAAVAASSCPVPHDQRTADHPMLAAMRPPPGGAEAAPLDPTNMMPAANQNPAPGQRRALSTRRMESNIPKGEVTPVHQAEKSDRWVYPSPQMFFNAMRRKGWEPAENDMDRVVAIHNTVNERSWQGVLDWESLHAGECEAPRLLKFQGLAQDHSPKARLRSLLGFSLPFDRHDWTVDRCGRKVRYIIDFYTGEAVGGKPLSMHLDIRPALDSPQAVFDRFVRMPLRDAARFLGVTRADKASAPQK